MFYGCETSVGVVPGGKFDVVADPSDPGLTGLNLFSERVEARAFPWQTQRVD